MVKCEYTNVLRECVTCGKQVKKGFLVGDAEFVCSQECGKDKVPSDEDDRQTA